MWDSVKDMLAPAVDRSHGRWTMEHLYHAVLTGSQNLWVIFDDDMSVIGVAMTQRVVYPNSVVLAYQFLGGTDFGNWVSDLLEVTGRFAKDIGCSTVEGVGRFGFWPYMKKEGWSKTYCIFEKSLVED